MKRIILSLSFLLYILNTTVAQYNYPKWEFGAEVGFASIKLVYTWEFKIQNKTEEITLKDRTGFRVSALAIYNINGRMQIIGGLGMVNANGRADKKTIESRSGFFSPTVNTSTNETINQKYKLIELPVYLRWHLIGKHRAVSKKINIFFDIGGSYKSIITNESSFIKKQRILRGSNSTTNTTTNVSQEGSLELRSKLSVYSAFGFLIGDRASIGFTSSRINTQGEQDLSIRHKSKLKSVVVTVFF